MANRLSANKLSFMWQCVGLSSAPARALVFGVVILGLFLLNPPFHPIPHACFIHDLFGICPACGSTRALALFFKGSLLESLEYNWNVILTGPLIIVLFLRDVFKSLKSYQAQLLPSSRHTG